MRMVCMVCMVSYAKAGTANEFPGGGFPPGNYDSRARQALKQTMQTMQTMQWCRRPLNEQSRHFWFHYDVARGRDAGEVTMRKRRRRTDGVLMTVNPILKSKVASGVTRLGRARRVGRDQGVVDRSDYGHGIRLKSIRTRDGDVLREADVTVEDAPDPNAPRTTVRRARRTDSLMVLYRAGTIEAHHLDAGEMLRAQMEASSPSMPGMVRSEVHVAPFLRSTVSDRQLRACSKVRSAIVALGATRSVVEWILLNGTIGGYARHTQIRHTTAAGLLRDGLDRLARHFDLAPVSACD